MRVLPIGFAMLASVVPAAVAKTADSGFVTDPATGAQAARQLSAPAAPPVASGQAEVQGGGKASWEYHYNRNALLDSRPVGDGWIALTQAGNLLLFDRDLLRVRKEHISSVAATCLGADDKGAVIAGFEDGSIMSVHPSTLVLSQIAAVEGPAAWIGHRTTGWVVVHQPPPVEKTRWAHHDWAVTDLGTKKTHRFAKIGPDSFMLDRRGRLWLGEDHGEFGGGASMLDLYSGKIRCVDPPAKIGPNVYGFIELADGQVWAFGGIMHMGLAAWHVTRMDSQPPRSLASHDNLKERGASPPPGPPARPSLPITHIVEEKSGDLLVFSYSDVFRVDRALRNWRHVATLKLQYISGRPDAMGSYPAVRRALDLERGRTLLVTGSNGHVLLEGYVTTPRELPGQLGLNSQHEAVDSPAGLLVVPESDREEPWRLDRDRWILAEAAPPMRYHPLDPFGQALDKADIDESWWNVRLMKAPSGAWYGISSTGSFPGTRAVDRWERDRFVPISTSRQSFVGHDCFFTPDGDLWARDFMGDYFRLVGDTWESVGSLKPDKQEPKKPPRFVMNLKPIGTAGPPWLYFHRRGKELVRFSVGKDKSKPTLEAVAVNWGERPVAILDALGDPDGSVLVAAEEGVFRYDRNSGALATTDLVPAGEPVRSLVRDGRGRLWLIGKGIKIVLPGHKAAAAVTGLPIEDAPGMELLGSHPAHPGGVIVGLQARGILFVETTP